MEFPQINPMVARHPANQRRNNGPQFPGNTGAQQHQVIGSLLGSRDTGNRLGPGSPLRSPSPPGNPMAARSAITDQDIPGPGLLLLAISLSRNSSR